MPQKNNTTINPEDARKALQEEAENRATDFIAVVNADIAKREQEYNCKLHFEMVINDAGGLQFRRFAVPR